MVPLSIPSVAFWVLTIWGLYDGDLYPKEGGILIGIWAATLAAFMALHIQPVLFIVPVVLLDIVLILKVFGGDIAIR